MVHPTLTCGGTGADAAAVLATLFGPAGLATSTCTLQGTVQQGSGSATKDGQP